MESYANEKVSFDDRILALRQEYEPQIEEKRKAIADLQSQKADLEDFRENKEIEQGNLDMWKQNVEQLQTMHKNLIEGIERDRIKQIDKLRKDMLMQIRTVRMKNSVTNED